MKYYYLNKITLLLTFLLFLGCKSAKNTSNQSSQIENESKILFLNYVIKKNDNGERFVEFINKKIAVGKVKQNPFESIENGVQGDLVFKELNKKKQIIHEALIRNPLVKKMEYVDEHKQFKTSVVDFDEMQFSLRLQLKSSTKTITISNFGETEPLIITQIQ